MRAIHDVPLQHPDALARRIERVAEGIERSDGDGRTRPRPRDRTLRGDRGRVPGWAG
jgi:hypothetical protein